MNQPWVWVDFENTPHVLFLSPLIEHLVQQGHTVQITARHHAQTLELAKERGFQVRAVGSGDRTGLGRKVLGGLGRVAGLASVVLRDGRPNVLVSCSRAASLVAWLLRVPAITLLDYEHAEQRTLAVASRVIWFPDLLSDAPLPPLTRRVARFYEGLKENLYLDRWPVDRGEARRQLDVANGEYLVVARPPADTAHYAHAGAMRVWLAAVNGLASRAEVRVLVVARSKDQRERLEVMMGDVEGKVDFLSSVVAGPLLVAAADLVLGGGGTMNREAAVLGTPAWSAFTGPTPRIDDCLAAEGRLLWVRDESELRRALQAPLPGRQSKRGPYPRGLAAILTDLDARVTSRSSGHRSQ